MSNDENNGNNRNPSHKQYWKSREKTESQAIELAKGANKPAKQPMTQGAAKRIQKHADKNKTNQAFKGRAMKAGKKNSSKKR